MLTLTDDTNSPLSRMAAALGLALCLLWGGAAAQTLTHVPPAQLTCPGDVVVRVNTHSGVYHYRGERYFGSTKSGKFACEKDAKAEGDRPTRNGQ